jgi:uncharacterized protein (DUF433 family)
MEVVKIDPEIMSGTPCFAGTRVPVQSLVDWLAGGYTLDYWLYNFPSVSREQAEGLLQQGIETLVERAQAPQAV